MENAKELHGYVLNVFSPKVSLSPKIMQVEQNHVFEYYILYVIVKSSILAARELITKKAEKD